MGVHHTRPLLCSRLFRSLSLSNASPTESPSPPRAPLIAWKPTGQKQKTLASQVEISGTALHSGARTTARLAPARAGEGRYFVSRRVKIPASIDYAVGSPRCTTLSKDGVKVRTVEHLLSALEASGVDNCRVDIEGGDEVPILDGSSKLWMELVRLAGLAIAEDCHGNENLDRMAPFLLKPLYLQRDDSFLAAFPSPTVQITYGINFPQVPAIGCQWFSCSALDSAVYMKEVAYSRTFCIHDEVVKLRASGLIQGGSLENAIVCSPDVGWLNPPLHFHDEPCRHKVLDLVGDLSLLAQNGSQGIPVAHVVAYKGGHSLHAELVRHILFDGRDGASSCIKNHAKELATM